MTWVKICGITNLEDARVAVDAGADALGFVFYGKSPRNVSTGSVADIVQYLPTNVDKIGVFADATLDEVLARIRDVGLTGVQLHSSQSPNIEDLQKLSRENQNLKRIWVCRTDQLLEKGSLFLSAEFAALLYALMFDSASTSQPGGTGQRFDWNAARGFIRSASLSIPTIVAGGLTPDNIGEAIRLLQPYGVDVSSGVEARPGKKDPHKVEAFIRAVRNQQRTA
jgi:phosphoribosylanthranilate isomerase